MQKEKQKVKEFIPSFFQKVTIGICFGIILIPVIMAVLWSLNYPIRGIDNWWNLSTCAFFFGIGYLTGFNARSSTTK